jgi:hypothetical protein
VSRRKAAREAAFLCLEIELSLCGQRTSSYTISMTSKPPYRRKTAPVITRLQPREHHVPCSRCGRMTLNASAVCNSHPIR